VIIDDPLKPGDANSEVVREKVIEWYRSTLVTRADDKKAARIVVVMQRVHVEDLVGYLQEQGGYEVLNLPAVAQSTQTYALGNGRSYTRQAGELLHPDHEPVEVLLDIKKNMGSMAFSAQYQQSPEPPSGKIIKRKYLQYYSKLPELEERDRIIVSWDIALSEKETADYSAGVAMLKRGEKYYVLEVVRGRFPFSQLKDQIMAMKQRYGRVSLVIEESAISIGLIQSLQERHVNVVAIKPVQDKKARVISQIDLFEGGSVLLPESAPWLEDFVAELLSFQGRYDDQVDALVQGLAWRRAEWQPPPVQRRSIGAS
jgi:predicted phage terminase large subunit-like protein